MKQINDYWVDENNNRWDCELYTEAEAERCSKTLIDCTECTDCINCNNCNNCDYCDNCYNCTNFIENPQVYKTKKIGSRYSQTIFYYGETDKGMEVQVVCGCFRGNLEAFENAVMKTHANNDEYREQYLKEIAKVKSLFELNKEE